jgi:hypothetical protein
MQVCLGSQATPGILRIALMAEDLRLLVSCLLYWASTTNSAWQSHGLRPKLGPKSSSKFLNVLLRFVAFCISFDVSIVSILLVFHIFVADSHCVPFIFRLWTHSLDTFSGHILLFKTFQRPWPRFKAVLLDSSVAGPDDIYCSHISDTNCISLSGGGRHRCELELGALLRFSTTAGSPSMCQLLCQHAPCAHASALKLFHLGKFGIYFLVFKADGTGYQWTRKSRLMKTWDLESMLSDMVRGGQMLSDMVRCGQMLSDMVRCVQMLSDMVRCGQMLSDVVRCGQMWSGVVRCCQMLSHVVICCKVW